MPRRPYMKFYPTDFLAGTQGMSPSALGWYIKLICWCWIDGEVPHPVDNWETFCLLIGDKRGKRWQESGHLWVSLSHHFKVIRPGYISNNRVLEELSRYKTGCITEQKQNRNTTTVPGRGVSRPRRAQPLPTEDRSYDRPLASLTKAVAGSLPDTDTNGDGVTQEEVKQYVRDFIDAKKKTIAVAKAPDGTA